VGGVCVFDPQVLSINDRPPFSPHQRAKTLVHELLHMLLGVEGARRRPRSDLGRQVRDRVPRRIVNSSGLQLGNRGAVEVTRGQVMPYQPLRSNPAQAWLPSYWLPESTTRAARPSVPVLSCASGLLFVCSRIVPRAAERRGRCSPVGQQPGQVHLGASSGSIRDGGHRAKKRTPGSGGLCAVPQVLNPSGPAWRPRQV
jgi:hypothetical protein